MYIRYIFWFVEHFSHAFTELLLLLFHYVIYDSNSFRAKDKVG